MDRPMPDILPALPLADEIVEALLAHEGMLGATLHCVLAYEQGDWEAVHNLGCPRDLLVKTYLEALMWATEMHNFLSFSWGGIPIDPYEASWTFVSFLTFTSTYWQWRTDIPSQETAALASSPLLLSPPLATSTAYADANCYQGTKGPGVALLACDLLYGVRRVEPYTAIGWGRAGAPTDGSCRLRRAAMPQHQTTRVSLRALSVGCALSIFLADLMLPLGWLPASPI